MKSKPRVLIACDKFKGALDAAAACAAVAEPFQDAGWEADVCPLTDGGDGFARILTQAAGGRWIAASVCGPLWEPVEAGFGLVDDLPAAVRAESDFSGIGGPFAIVEMAAASGLEQVPGGRRDPWRTTSRGTGELMRKAAAAGARAVLLGVGGSATNDIGLGALVAMGLAALDGSGARVDPPFPADWARIVRFSGGPPRDFPPIFVACDVTNPLLGPDGCTEVFGPQKGLRETAHMESAMRGMAELLAGHFGAPPALASMPGMGAAGGIAFGLACATGAKIVSGSQLAAIWLALDERVASARLVITGEGRLDCSSLAGKGPGDVARRTVEAGRACVVLAGSLADGLVVPEGISTVCINPPEDSGPGAIPHTRERLRAAAAALARGESGPGREPSGDPPSRG